jgi:hypothetical protein
MQTEEKREKKKEEDLIDTGTKRRDRRQKSKRD